MPLITCKNCGKKKMRQLSRALFCSSKCCYEYHKNKNKTDSIKIAKCEVEDGR